jgi:hypothetical protein
MSPEHLCLGAAIEAGDVLRVDAAPDRHGWLEEGFRFGWLRLAKVSQRLVDLRNNCRDIDRGNTVLTQIRCNDLCDLFFH